MCLGAVNSKLQHMSDADVYAKHPVDSPLLFMLKLRLTYFGRLMAHATPELRLLVHEEFCIAKSSWLHLVLEDLRYLLRYALLGGRLPQVDPAVDPNAWAEFICSSGGLFRRSYLAMMHLIRQRVLPSRISMSVVCVCVWCVL